MDPIRRILQEPSANANHGIVLIIRGYQPVPRRPTKDDANLSLWKAGFGTILSIGVVQMSLWPTSLKVAAAKLLTERGY